LQSKASTAPREAMVLKSFCHDAVTRVSQGSFSLHQSSRIFEVNSLFSKCGVVQL
jgi:regulator of sigma D